MNWCWIVNSQFDLSDEGKIVDVLILQGNANKLGAKHGALLSNMFSYVILATSATTVLRFLNFRH